MVRSVFLLEEKTSLCLANRVDSCIVILLLVYLSAASSSSCFCFCFFVCLFFGGGKKTNTIRLY